MMGCGKTAVGRAVAERAGVPFVDLDHEVEKQAGSSIRQIFEKRGEEAFRSMESEALARQLADPTPRVVALGGGSLLARRTRLLALERSIVITLTAEPGELVRRLSGDAARPLLGDTPSESRLRDILELRSAAYAEAHALLATDGIAIDKLATDVLRFAELEAIAVPLGGRTYTVEIVPEAADTRLQDTWERLTPSAVIVVTDEIVEPLVLPRLSRSLARDQIVKVVLPSGERHKTLASVERILTSAIEARVDRHALVVGIGGGVVTDVAGLAAALALRGLRWVAVPTTVLSMVDASVGGKTAVDLGAAKNAVGAFHQPARVVVDPTFSRTESDRALRGGFAEVVKTALIGDPALFDELSSAGAAERLRDRDPSSTARAIRSSIAVKAGIVGRDEREQGERAHLNLGHTVGHALEAEGGFERLTHGEAVSLGLVAALRVGVALGVTDRNLASRVEQVLERLGLPIDLDQEPLDRAMRWVTYDKKRQAGALRLVLVRAPGSVEIVAVAPSELASLLVRS
jgi:shikimate kinase/3-dehydroquinate synthase